jgi:hypothetical protein
VGSYTCCQLIKQTSSDSKEEQAGAELCQAQFKLGLAKQAVTEIEDLLCMKLRLHSIKKIN